MHSIISLCALQVFMLLPLPGPDHFAGRIDQNLLASAKGIDAVYVSGTLSHLKYLEKHDTDLSRPPFPVYGFKPRPIPFGNCSQTNNTFSRQDAARCGYLIPLAGNGRTANLLGYDEVSLSGQFSGTWEVAYSGGPAGAAGYTVPVGTISTPAGGRFALGPIFRGADASRGGQLVLRLVSRSGSASLDEVCFSHTAHHPGETGRGVWIWDRDKVLGKEDRVLEKLSAYSITRVYLRVGDDPGMYRDFLRKAVQRGIEVYALDGNPSHVAAPEALLARIKAVESYNRTHPDARFSGFQTDIEPYLGKDLTAGKGGYATAYVDLLAVIKRGFSVPLSVVVPFWFDTIHEGGRSLAQGIVETADEVVVVSHRTDAATVFDMTRATLSLGEQFNKPVLLGVELGPVTSEHHVKFDVCTPQDSGAVKVGDQWLCRRTEYDVDGSGISFRSRMADLPAFMTTDVPFASFKGWVLNSFEDFP